MNPFKLSRAAESDLDGIVEYLTRKAGPGPAIRLVDDFESAFHMLASHPGAGHRHAYVADPDARVWIVHSYLIIYWPDDVPLGIARVVHGHRDLGNIQTPRP